MAIVATPVSAQSLKGSTWSMDRQVRVADQHDYSRLKTSNQVKKFVEMGLLVRVPGNANYELSGVSYPYARPEVRLFIERLSQQYRAATGEKLVVTSLTRPLSRQPRNASKNSVHPTGMAIDLRRPGGRNARKWLEHTLLTLEGRGVLEATRERRPSHYHIAVFPTQYAAYVERKTGKPFLLDANAPETASSTAGTNSNNSGVAASMATEVMGPQPAAKPAPPPPVGKQPVSSGYSTYTVSRGDSLWGIAQRFGTSVGRIKTINGMRTARIVPGQKLMVPANGR